MPLIVTGSGEGTKKDVEHAIRGAVEAAFGRRNGFPGLVKGTIKVPVAHVFALSRATNTSANVPDSTGAGTGITTGSETGIV